MIVTTTPNIEGKRIKEYLGLVTGTDIYMVGGLLGGGLANQEKLFKAAFDNACSKMKTKAESLGADAVVGVSYTVSAPGNTNHIIVTVMGTAASSEDKEETDELPDMF